MLFDRYRFEFTAGFSHDLRMRLVKEKDLSVLSAVRSRMREFFDDHGIFRLSEHTSVDPVVDYLAVHQMMTVDRSGPGCVGRFPSLWNSGVVHVLEEYRTTSRDHGESTRRFLPAVAVVSLESFT